MKIYNKHIRCTLAKKQYAKSMKMAVNKNTTFM